MSGPFLAAVLGPCAAREPAPCYRTNAEKLLTLSSDDQAAIQAQAGREGSAVAPSLDLPRPSAEHRGRGVGLADVSRRKALRDVCVAVVASRRRTPSRVDLLDC